MESVLGSPLGQQSIALLEHTLEERARAGETSGPSVASVWRALSEALAAERQHFRAMAARRRASRAYVGAADSATLDFAAALDAVDALKQACVELRYGVVTEVDVIDLGVELVRDGGPFAGDEALMELACLDSRLDGECARAGFALDRALEVHAAGWRLEVNGHELARLVLDLAVQRFLEESAAAGSSARETESGMMSYGSVRPLADLVTAMHADLGSLPWLELFHVGGASGTVMSFDDHNPEEVDALREACSAYLADRSGAGDCDALKARERIGERAERERALQRAYEDFNRGREALRQGRSGAETALRAAVSAFERWLPGSRWTATAQNELALALKAKGRLQAAAALLREAHDYFITHHGEGDPDSATTMHNLVRDAQSNGRVRGGRHAARAFA